MGFFLSLLISAAMTVLSDLLAPKPDLQDAKPAQLGDFNVPTATEDRPLPHLWGTVRIDGLNVAWAGDLIQEAIMEKVKTGLFSSERVLKGFRYYLGMQWAYCHGEVDHFSRWWIKKEIVYDETAGTPAVHGDTISINEPELFGGEDTGRGGVVGDFEFFGGTPTQSPSTYLSTFQKFPPVTGDTPSYQGVCYMAPLAAPTLWGTSTSLARSQVELRRAEKIPHGLTLGPSEEVIDGGANAAAVFYEILTSKDFPYVEPASSIDNASFEAAAVTLAIEGNGFSFLLDRKIDPEVLVDQIEEQIDGLLRKNPITGKWTITLMRDDYDINTIPEVNADNLLELLPGWNDGTYEDTLNEVEVPFTDPADDYRGRFGFAQDMANARIVGELRSTKINHPGCKNAQLATDLAWRELRTLAVPLASGGLLLDRSFYGILAGDVLAFTHEKLGYIKLPIRVREVDYGNLLNGEIRVLVIQDVFRSAKGSFAPPPITSGTAFSSVLAAYPLADQLAFEAPRALTSRDPGTFNPQVDKVFFASRKIGTEITAVGVERNAAGVPAGSYSDNGQAFQFMLAGELQGSMGITASQPLASLIVTDVVDSQADILAAFPNPTPPTSEVGVELNTLCLIDDEFILVSSAIANGGNVELLGVYRGVLDSVQATHTAGTRIYFLFNGAAVGEESITAGNNVDYKLLPRGVQGRITNAAATAIQFQMDDRTRRPYPPSSFDLDGVTLDTTDVNIDATGSGDDLGFVVDEIIRRDFETPDEIEALTVDAATIFSDFPSANSTDIDLEMRDGATVLFTTTGISGTSTTVRQLDILEALDTTTLPVNLTIALRQSHTVSGTVHKSRSWFALEFSVASQLVGLHAFGALSQAEESGAYTVVVADTGTNHDFTLSTAFTVGNVEVKVNAGAWVTLITAGGTTGSVSAPTTGDEIRIRHQSSDVTPQKLLEMKVGATSRGYAVMIA